MRIVGVPCTPHGPDLERFAAACVEHRPKLYLTTAVLHNPTGLSVSAVTAHRLLRLAETYGLILVEDCIYADLEARPSSGLAALDGFERVILLGSFSKTLTGALRCGFIAARGDWIEGLTDLALATSFGTSDVAAQVTHRLLTDGSYRRHLDNLRARLARAMAGTIGQLDRLGLSSSDIAIRALEKGLVLAPGNVFSATHTADRYLRFNVAQCGEKRVFDGLAAAMER